MCAQCVSSMCTGLWKEIYVRWGGGGGLVYGRKYYYANSPMSMKWGSRLVPWTILKIAPFNLSMIRMDMNNCTANTVSSVFFFKKIIVLVTER